MCKLKSYMDSDVRQGMYPAGFNPSQFLRLAQNDDGSLRWLLDYDVKRHWFRLIYPDGRIDSQVTQPTPDCAVAKVRIYANKSDKPEEYLAEATAMRTGTTDPNGKFYERYFLDSAETAAASRALSNAGFDLIGCNVVKDGCLVNPVTGETVTESQVGMLAGFDGSAPSSGNGSGSPNVKPHTAAVESTTDSAVHTKKYS